MNAPETAPYPFADLALARRLERTEARASVDFVEARAAVTPAVGACHFKVAGAFVLFDGVKSPITQTFGLGLFEPATPADLDRIEAFYRERHAPVFHEVSPLADLSLFTFLSQRGYQPVEFTSILYRPIWRGFRVAAPRNDALAMRLIQEDEYELWARTAAEGWSELTDLADIMLDLARVSAERAGAFSFLVELRGRPIATGALSLCDGVAMLAGASTIPEGRRQGAQLALLEGRLRYAAEHGCDLALMGAAPGSASQRNAERHGFRIAYTRIKWGLDLT